MHQCKEIINIFLTVHYGNCKTFYIQRINKKKNIKNKSWNGKFVYMYNKT